MIYSRLTFPLCYNFLSMVDLADLPPGDPDISGFPTFIQVLGPAVKLTPLFGERYNDWFPYIILIISTIVLFNLHNRILALLRIKDFVKISDQSPHIEEGKQIIDTGKYVWITYTSRNSRLNECNVKPAQWKKKDYSVVETLKMLALL